MPHYRGTGGQVYWFDREEEKQKFQPLLVALTAAEEGAILNPQRTAAELWAAYQQTAQAALSASDMVALRCFKAGVAFPAAWQAYVTELRAIIATAIGTPGTLPVMPAYPAGT